MPRLQDLAQSRKDAFLVSIEKLKPGENVREDFSDLSDLGISLFNMGQLQPLRVSLSEDGSSAIIRDGERRYRAAKYVNDHYEEWSRGHVGGHKFDVLLCISAGQNIDPITRILQQIEANDQAKPLQPMERAKAFKVLCEKGLSQVEIAKRLGKTAQFVSDALRLLDAPEEIKEAVRGKKMSATAATKVAKMKDPAKRAAAVERVKKGEKVKVKDVAEYTPLGLDKARKVIKKANEFMRLGKSQVDRARWMGIVHGIEMGVGLRPVEF